MSNFKQIIIVNADRQTKVPSLKEAFTKSGKSIYSGALFWKTGRKKENFETAEYANMKFFTWDKTIYELFKNNPAKSFLIEGNLYPDEYFSEKSNTNFKGFKVCVNKAEIHVWEKKQEPVAHFQEVDNEIPF